MSNIFSNILSRAAPSIFGGLNQPAQIPVDFIGPTQPQPQGPAFPTPGQRVGQLAGKAGRATNRLFENPAFTSALASFGQRATQAAQRGEGFGLGFTGALGGFAPDFIRAQEGAMLAQQEQARNAIVDQLRQAQTAQIQARTAAAGQPEAITPFQRESLDIRRQQLEATQAAKAASKPFTTVQKTEFRQNRDEIQSGINAVRTLIKEGETDPSKLGALGAVRTGAETVGGVLGDIGQLIPGLRGITGIAREIAGEDTIRGLQPLRNKLATGLARARFGSGRIPVQQIERAEQDTALIGTFGAQQGLDALRAVERELQASLTALGERTKAGGFNLKLKTPVTPPTQTGQIKFLGFE